MADTVYLKDGTTEYLMNDPLCDLMRLVRERLGDDCARAFQEVLDCYTETLHERDALRRDFEISADEYLDTCRSVIQTIDEVLDLIQRPGKNNKAEIVRLLGCARGELDRSL